MSSKDFKAIKSLKLIEDIRILQVDKGSCTVVLDELEYKKKVDTLLISGSL
jgi:hypothetical protein